MNELKNCPFCGRKPNLSRWFDKDGCWFIISCPGCGTEKMYLGEKVAIEKWNTRPTEDAKDKEIERLKEALKQIVILRITTPEMRCAEDAFCNLYCTMGDIAKTALSNAPDNNVGRMEEN